MDRWDVYYFVKRRIWTVRLELSSSWHTICFNFMMFMLTIFFPQYRHSYLSKTFDRLTDKQVRVSTEMMRIRTELHKKGIDVDKTKRL